MAVSPSFHLWEGGWGEKTKLKVIWAETTVASIEVSPFPSQSAGWEANRLAGGAAS